MTGVAQAAPTHPDQLWEDLFERNANDLGGSWVEPGSPFDVVWPSPGQGVAYATGGGSVTAWRDTGHLDHMIEVKAYKLANSGAANAIGGVTVAQDGGSVGTDGDTFVGYELVKSGTEAKSVLYMSVDGELPAIELDVRQHSELRVDVTPDPDDDQLINMRVSKVGSIVKAFLDVGQTGTYTEDIVYDLNDAPLEEDDPPLDGTNVGLVNFSGLSNYGEVRAFRFIEPPPVDPPDPTPTPEEPTTGPTPPPDPAPTATSTPPATPTSTPPPTKQPSKPTIFTEKKNDISAGADLRKVTVGPPGKTIVFTTTHRSLTKKPDVGVIVYVDTNASKAGPEFKVSTVVNNGKKVSVNRVKNWVTKKPVTCTTSRTVSYSAETVRLTLAPACLASTKRFRVSVLAQQRGQSDWGPSRRGFYAWLTR